MKKSYFLELEGIFAHYDQVKQIAFIVYSGHLNVLITTQVYEWMTHFLKTETDTRVNGCVFDFQKVIGMEENNILITQIVSEEINQKFDLSGIPVALIVGHLTLSEFIQHIVETSPQPERKQLVFSIEEAFAFINQFQPPPETPPHMLDTGHVSCHFDPALGDVYITYYDVLTAESTASVYTWMGKTLDIYGEKAMDSCIFDFRKVSRFDPTNTRKVSQTSGQLNTSYDMSHIPVALITRDTTQEQLIRMTMHLTPQEKRKKIVHSAEAAWEFINSFKQEKI